jgi:EAL domain-containing protein (putative c-di-GMP-specific phosphodiesterase class I)
VAYDESNPRAPVATQATGHNEFLCAIADLVEATAGRPLICVALDLGDLRRSSRIARTLGPNYTNGLVNSAKSRIQRAIGSDIHLFQVDIDCFAFVLPDDGTTVWQSLVEGLIEQLRLPLECGGLPGAVAPSAGLVRFGTGDVKAGCILHQAMAAACEARELDVAWRLHDHAADSAHHRLRTLLAGLPVALTATDQLSLVYQPRIDLQSGVCLSAEALLRWNHPTLGIVSPVEFIPIAEHTGMMRSITGWVVKRALGDLAGWTRAGFGHGVSINISPVNLVEDNFAGKLVDAVRWNDIDPTRVELEFTESVLVRNTARVRSTMKELAAHGVGISIDDFGTGYSNLQYLREIPANVLKIDQSFVRLLTTNGPDPVIVRSVIGLGHSLGYRVVAEGIEDGEVMAILAGWGCDEGQGYHISRPVTVAAMQTWLSARSTDRGTN